MRIRKIISAILQKVGYTSFKNLTINELTSDATLYYTNENGQEVYVKYPNTNPTPVSSVCRLALQLSQSASALTWQDNSQTINTWEGNNLMISIGQHWNSELEEWHNYGQYIFIYDANGNMLSQMYQTWSKNDVWVNNRLYLSTYDSNNNLSIRITQKWSKNDWLNQNQLIYTYNENNNVLIVMSSQWFENSWANRNKKIFTYDSNNNILTQITQTLDVDTWVDDVKITYTYDSNNNLLTKISQYWDKGEWFNEGKMIYTYNENNNLLLEIKQTASGSTWENNSQTGNTWEGNNLIKSTSKLWDSDLEEWVIIDQCNQLLYTYDSNNNQLTAISQFWTDYYTASASTGNLTLNIDPVSGDTITIDSVTFEFGTAGTVSPGNIPILGDEHAIYIMNSHLTNVLVKSDSRYILTFMARIPGIAGDLIEISSSFGEISGPTLTGGSDGVAAATGMIFLDSRPTDGNTLTIDSVTFEFGDTVSPGNISIPDSSKISEIYDIINSSVTNCYTSELINAGILITANNTGLTGNLIEISASFGTVSGPTLAGGSDGYWRDNRKYTNTWLTPCSNCVRVIIT